jgi:hypothetical protein
MEQERNAQFEAERLAVELRHCCEDCGHFDAQQDACAHEWPNTRHRLDFYRQPGTILDFCKEFELL